MFLGWKGRISQRNNEMTDEIVYDKAENRTGKQEQEGETNDSLIRTIQELYQPKFPDRKSVEETAKLAASGKFDQDSRAAVAGAAYEAYQKGGTYAFEAAVNKKLEEMKSPYRIKVDESLAKVQDVGYLGVELIDKRTGKTVDSAACSINNSPRVPEPPFHFNERFKQEDQLPPDWPRLDIPEFPGKKK